MVNVSEEPMPFEEALTRAGNGTYNIFLLVTCSLILLTIIMDLFGFTMVVNVACDLELTVSQKAILFSLPFASIMLASYPWGYISDTKGRRFTLVITMPTAFVLSCLSSLSPNWIILGVLKFLSVCFSCAANSVTYTLVGESCAQRVRSKYMLMMTCLMLLGPACGAIISYSTLHLDFELPIPGLGINFTPWRLLLLFMSVPIGLESIAVYLFYESPKFLANWERNDEALKILSSIYSINYKCSKSHFKVESIKLEDFVARKKRSLLHAIYEQSAPLFRQPLLGRTLLLFYIVAVAYIINNTCLVWLPHILDQVSLALVDNSSAGSICTMLSKLDGNETLASEAIIEEYTVPAICLRYMDKKIAMAIVVFQVIFSSLNFLIAYLPDYRKRILIFILVMTGLSGGFLNLTPEPISSVILYMVLSGTCLTMGILAAYFVDLYPTSYRGMVSCLSIMVGRSFAFIGINIVGNVIFHHCTVMFYFGALLVLSSGIAACFLPPDKPKNSDA